MVQQDNALPVRLLFLEIGFFQIPACSFSNCKTDLKLENINICYRINRKLTHVTPEILKKKKEGKETRANP